MAYAYNNNPKQKIFYHLPQTKFYNTFKRMRGEKTKLFLGVELEVEAKRSEPLAAERTIELLGGNAILKPEHMSHGFEIVTLPATLNYHRAKLWGEFFEQGKDFLEGTAGYPSTCGLHVHFSRAGCGDATLAKVLAFYHEEHNWPFLTTIAGRHVGVGGAYNNWNSKKALVEGNPDLTIQQSNKEKFAAIWISNRNNGKTAEVRIFQSKVDRNHVMSCLEFVVAVIEWCKTEEAKHECLKFERLIQWFSQSKNRIRFPYLAGTLVKNSFIMEQDIIVEKADNIIEKLRKKLLKNKAA